jgi:transcriptional regulator with XRE-family HTH domain
MSARLPSIDLGISRKLRGDRVYRQAFFLAESSALIAKQLIELRKRRGLNQSQVAEELETAQPAISRVERADYRNWSFNTLRRLADAMDARLRVIIEPSEDVLGEYEGEMKPNADSSKISDYKWLTREDDSAPLKPKITQHNESAANFVDQIEQRQQSSLLDKYNAGERFDQPPGPLRLDDQDVARRRFFGDQREYREMTGVAWS